MSSLQEARSVRSQYADDPDFQELLHLFVAAIPEHRQGLEAAHRTQQFDSLRRIAHQLKGSGGGYGFPELSRRAAALEDSCKSSDADQIDRTLDALLAHLGCITV